MFRSAAAAAPGSLGRGCTALDVMFDQSSSSRRRDCDFFLFVSHSLSHSLRLFVAPDWLGGMNLDVMFDQSSSSRRRDCDLFFSLPHSLSYSLGFFVAPDWLGGMTLHVNQAHAGGVMCSLSPLSFFLPGIFYFRTHITRVAAALCLG